MTDVIHPTELPHVSWTAIVDVRTADEYLQEHIPGSLNIPLDRIAQEAAKLNGQPEIILSCRSGKRAQEAQNVLYALGCRNLKVLEGGLLGWKAAKLPTRALKKGFSMMQQVQLIVGSMVLVGTLYKPFWILALIAGLGLLTAGLTNTCLLATILSKMPWNRSSDSTSCSLP